MTRERSSPARRHATSKRAGAATPSAAGPRSWQGLDHASRATADILAGPVVWGGIGWLGDRWLGTDPWLMSIGIMGGFAGGLYLIWLRTTQPQQQQDAPPSPRGTDDSDTEA